MESNIFNNNINEEKDYFQEAKEIYYRLEKVNKKHLQKNNINTEFVEYSNNTLANTRRIKDLYDKNKFRKYNLITGKEKIERIPVINKNIEKSENKKIQDMIESIPNLSTHNKIRIKMKASILDFNEEKDISQKCQELKDFYNTNADNSIRKRKKKDITLKISYMPMPSLEQSGEI